MLLFITNSASAQQVTLSNNLLYDAALTPNLRVGLRLSEHWSMGLTAGYRPWPTNDDTNRKWKHLLLSPSLRYWKDSVNVHHFFGANVIYSHYNVADVKFPFGLYKSVRDERRQGDLLALGVFYGYSWPLGRYWNLEPFIGVAVGYTWYDRYECGHCGTKLGREHKLFAMPQAGINIVYNIPGRAKRVPRAVLVDTYVDGYPPVVRNKPYDPVVRSITTSLRPVASPNDGEQDIDEHAKIINEAQELLTADCADCHHEALRLLQQVQSDERAQNALGVALWFCGQKKEALDCLRRAAANGNPEAKENLKHLEARK